MCIQLRVCRSLVAVRNSNAKILHKCARSIVFAFFILFSSLFCGLLSVNMRGIIHWVAKFGSGVGLYECTLLQFLKCTCMWWKPLPVERKQVQLQPRSSGVKCASATLTIWQALCPDTALFKIGLYFGNCCLCAENRLILVLLRGRW